MSSFLRLLLPSPGRLTLVLALCVEWLGASIPSSASEPVYISEFLAGNRTGLLDEDGAASDWIEIHNASSLGVNLLGWHLTDDTNDLKKWTFPATNLAGKEFMVVFASGKDRAVAGAPLHTSFGLNSSGDYLALVHPDGVTIASEFAPTYPPQHADFSYGSPQQVAVRGLVSSNAAARVFVPTNDALGLSWATNGFNDSSWIRGTNGVGYATSVPGFAVRTFKASAGVAVDSVAKAEAVIATPAQHSAVYSENSPVVNYVNTGSGAHYASDRTVPGFAIGVDQEDFVIEAVATITIPTAGNWTFGVNSDDGFKLTIGSQVEVCDCLRGPADTIQTLNFPAPGDYPLRLVFFERGGGSEVELFAAPGSLASWGASFALVGDTAHGGLSVRALPVSAGTGGGGFPFLRTDVRSQMLSNSPTAFVRLPFNATNIAALTGLTLTMKYNDGFVAYLNGVEVARRNVPASVSWNSTAPSVHNASAAEEINLTERLGLMREGTNLLAVVGLNDAPDAPDFFIEAQLAEVKVTMDGSGLQYFATPTPGAPNTGTKVAGFVGDTHFNVDRGFYETNLTVEVTCATPGAAIYYTRDGSVPSPSNGTLYTVPIAITNTTTLRAAAYVNGLYPSAPDTQTYLFTKDVIRQKEATAPGVGWPAPRARGTGSQTYDYGMDQAVVNSASVSPTILSDLTALPSFSLVADLKDLFDPQSGIYANPSGDTAAWERPCSIELLYPDGSKGFQANCGMRVRGGFSRSPDNPKHGFRFFFRTDYGPGSLKYPLFGPDGDNDLQKFDLRTFQNYSWSFGGDPLFIGLRDVFSRDAQLAMGQPSSHGEYYHLYLNGQYWGLYNTDERPEANFGAFYSGGSATNYDTIKVSPDDGYIIYATDGDLEAWTRLWMQATNGLATDAAYYKVQGMNPDGTPNPAYENLIDVDNLIDYMLVILYGGNLDAPISNFLGNNGPNNFFAMRDRAGRTGFRFVAHDSEHTLLDVSVSRIGPFVAGDPVTGGGLPKSNPQYIWQKMWKNKEFSTKVADHAQKHFFNGGALSAPTALSRFLTRSNEIYQAINTESARWGNSAHAPAFTRADWLTTMRFVAGTFIPQRVPVVVSQLRSAGLFPAVSAPILNRFGGLVPPGFNLYLTNGNAAGTIYYTLNGPDPRLRGGAINGAAIAYTPGAAISIPFQTVVRARVLSNAVWSALVEATFYTAQDFSTLVVSEIMYDPPAAGATPADSLEFLELKNAGTQTLDLSGLAFTAGISFTFSNGTRLDPGAFLVLGRDAATLVARYPGLVVNGIYGGKLDNAGERITLTHPLGGTLISFAYDNGGQWPVTPAGFGFSLVPRNPSSQPDPGNPIEWRASSNPGGSPGADDPAPVLRPILINEVLANSAPPDSDAIELYNPNDVPVNVGDWWLTDDGKVPQKYRLPANYTVPAGGYRVLREADFNAHPGAADSFALSSAGEEVYLLSGDSLGLLTGYSHGFNFGASPTGVTIGRYLTSTGDEKFELQLSNTLGGANSGPSVGPVVLNRILYHPPGLSTNADDVVDEFVEMLNLTAAPVPLFDPAYPTNAWKVRGGISMDFAPGLTLAPHGTLVLVGFDPTFASASAAFRARYPSFAASALYGPFTGKLNHDSDTVELERPDVPGPTGVAYLRVDRVEYRDRSPWPPAADGSGALLQRVHPNEYANDPVNWTAFQPLTILASPQNATVKAGAKATFSVQAIGLGSLHFQWRFNGADISGATNPVLTLAAANAPDRGDYTVAVADQTASGVTPPAALTVLIAPTIVVQPQSVTAVAGDTVSFTVAVTNTASLPVGFRWRRNGGTYRFLQLNDYSSTLIVSNVTLDATYSVSVTNTVSPAGLLSVNATLTVLPDSDGDHIPDAWETQYGLNPANAADALLDLDGDGLSNLDEFRAGTNPTNAANYLKVDQIRSGNGATVLEFMAISNRTYHVRYRDAISVGPWLDWTNVEAAPTNRLVAVTNAPLLSPRRFYRLSIP